MAKQFYTPQLFRPSLWQIGTFAGEPPDPVGDGILQIPVVLASGLHVGDTVRVVLVNGAYVSAAETTTVLPSTGPAP